MSMMLVQFQFKNLEEEEQELIPDFCDTLIELISSKLNNKSLKRKINVRLEYLINEAHWIDWDNGKKRNTTVEDLINAIKSSIIANIYKDGIWKIEIDTNVLIPNSYTSIDRFIRFLNYGDLNYKGTGIFTNLEHAYRYHKLNSLWSYFVLQKFGRFANSEIITV